MVVSKMNGHTTLVVYGPESESPFKCETEVVQ